MSSNNDDEIIVCINCGASLDRDSMLGCRLTRCPRCKYAYPQGSCGD